MEFKMAAQMALEAAPIGVVMVDEWGKIVLVNAEAERLFGYPRQEILGKSVEMLVPRRSRTAHLEFRADFSAAPRARAMGEGRDLFAVRKDGSEFPVEIGLNPVQTGDGRFVLSVIADITPRKAAEQELRQLNATLEERVAQRAREAEVRAVIAQRTAEALQREVDQRRQTEAELRAAKEAAEAASHAKSTFLANMSHEIRTPLNAVIGLTALVLETELSAEQEEYLNLVRDSGEALLQVINDILDFSKIEAGRMDLARNVFDHSEVVGDAMKSLALRSHSKGLELLFRLPPDMPVALTGDPHRLRQVIVNLVGNAIKFTDSGQVMLEANTQGRVGRQVELHYAVSDTGIGIPPEKRDDIFQAFEQVDGSSVRRHGGTGLGLAICRRLVEMMEGRIWVESQLGRGTTFHFTARFEVSEEAIPECASLESLKNRPVLVVDDNAINRHILTEMVRTWHMEPVEAATGQEALDALRGAFRAGQLVQIVIVDAHMPGMSGFALAEQIQRDKDLSKTVLLMLSSGEAPGDMARCQRLNIAAHLMKPIKQSELLQAITLALGIGSRSCPHAHSGPPGDLPPLRVLLAEDSLTNQRLAVAILQRQGHTVEVVETGNAALDKLAEEKFDVVLMDVRMPDMDGIEATRIIRARERLTGGHVPIVALTANAMQGDRQRCLEAGMDGYMTKPMQAPQLTAAIAQALTPGSPEAPSAAESAPGLEALEATPRPSQEGHINWEQALKHAYDDQQLLFDLANTFLEESPKALAQLRQAITRNDAESAGLAAHKIKGQFAVFGAREAAEAALEVERHAKRGELAMEALLHDLEEKTQQVRTALMGQMEVTPWRP